MGKQYTADGLILLTLEALVFLVVLSPVLRQLEAFLLDTPLSSIASKIIDHSFSRRRSWRANLKLLFYFLALQWFTSGYPERVFPVRFLHSLYLSLSISLVLETLAPLPPMATRALRPAQFWYPTAELNRLTLPLTT